MNDNKDKIYITQKDINVCFNDMFKGNGEGAPLSLNHIIQKQISNKTIDKYTKPCWIFLGNIINTFDVSLYLNSINNTGFTGLCMNNCNINEKTTVSISDFRMVEIINSTVKILSINNSRIIRLENVEVEALWIKNSCNIDYIELKNCSIDRLWLYNTIVQNGILITYGTMIGKIELDSTIVNNNKKNIINNSKKITVEDITDIYIEDDFETIARERFTMKDSLIINNNYTYISELPNKEKLYKKAMEEAKERERQERDNEDVRAETGEGILRIRNTLYPPYISDKEFLNSKSEEWNYKRNFREKNCMICGSYDSLDYIDDNDARIINNLREDI